MRRCINSWREKNPGWTVKCLDAASVRPLIPIDEFLDLDRQVVTAASLSDVIRILLLYEYGGVWVDATTFCNRPLDEWLPDQMAEGFFAFASPTHDRPLSSWFIAAEPNSPAITRWTAAVLRYWQNRERADHYFWFHNLFRELLETDAEISEIWARVPKISAGPPHIFQAPGMSKRAADTAFRVDWNTPIFKLTYRLEKSEIDAGSPLDRLLGGSPRRDMAPAPKPASEQIAATPLASLRVSTDNLGDHIQILASETLLNRLGASVTASVDRDDDIASARSLAAFASPVGIVLNGWFKWNDAEWPPSAKLAPLFIGFHARPRQSPSLLSASGISYLQRFQPVGCRDTYTAELLQNHGVETYVSGCLSLCFNRRIESEARTKIFVVSRDDRLLKALPPGEYEFVSHYSGSSDFEANMAEAHALLARYRSEAKLIITSLLHCALPAIAMGIPVIVFYPINDEAGHQSDRERFSSLELLTRIYRFDEMATVEWNPRLVDVGANKLAILEALYGYVTRLGWPGPGALKPIADSSELPVTEAAN